MENISQDMLIEILSYMEIVSLFALQRVCKTFQKAIIKGRSKELAQFALQWNRKINLVFATFNNGLFRCEQAQYKFLYEKAIHFAVPVVVITDIVDYSKKTHGEKRGKKPVIENKMIKNTSLFLARKEVIHCYKHPSRRIWIVNNFDIEHQKLSDFVFTLVYTCQPTNGICSYQHLRPCSLSFCDRFNHEKNAKQGKALKELFHDLFPLFLS